MKLIQFNTTVPVSQGSTRSEKKTKGVTDSRRKRAKNTKFVEQNNKNKQLTKYSSFIPYLTNKKHNPINESYFDVFDFFLMLF